MFGFFKTLLDYITNTDDDIEFDIQSENERTNWWLSIIPDFGEVNANELHPKKLMRFSKLLKSTGIELSKYTEKKDNGDKIDYLDRMVDGIGSVATQRAKYEAYRENMLDLDDSLDSDDDIVPSVSELKPSASSPLATGQCYVNEDKSSLKSSLSDNFLTKDYSPFKVVSILDTEHMTHTHFQNTESGGDNDLNKSFLDVGNEKFSISDGVGDHDLNKRLEVENEKFSLSELGNISNNSEVQVMHVTEMEKKAKIIEHEKQSPRQFNGSGEGAHDVFGENCDFKSFADIGSDEIVDLDLMDEMNGNIEDFSEFRDIPEDKSLLLIDFDSDDNPTRKEEEEVNSDSSFREDQSNSQDIDSLSTGTYEDVSNDVEDVRKRVEDLDIGDIVIDAESLNHDSDGSLDDLSNASMSLDNSKANVSVSSNDDESPLSKNEASEVNESQDQDECETSIVENESQPAKPPQTPPPSTEPPVTVTNSPKRVEPPLQTTPPGQLRTGKRFQRRGEWSPYDSNSAIETGDAWSPYKSFKNEDFPVKIKQSPGGRSSLSFYSGGEDEPKSPAATVQTFNRRISTGYSTAECDDYNKKMAERKKQEKLLEKENR